MADKLHDCDIPEAWTILRSHLQKELVGDLIPIPFVTEGDLYDLLTVFYKQDDGKGVLSRLTRPRQYELLGPLAGLADLAHSNRAELEACARPHLEELDFPAQYTCDLYGKSGKEIHLIVKQPHKKVVLLTATQPGDIVIDRSAHPALQYVDRVYLITEVVYSAGVDLVVSAAGRTKQYFSSRVLPLAFMYQKFPVDEYGAVGTEVPSGGDMKKMSFVQVRRSRRPDDPLPEAPRTSISARWQPAARRSPRDGLPLLPAAAPGTRGPLPPLPPD
ncbi:uncharacterized protein LOC122388210 [Amphibalanus amphitrite]|uniref:uncharacterized protein LOC122388210 n=1 Tax=Amphibalanus amphitrite TaxID=1232801 RepID=UPI001C92707A|nr:uncharacterized protein LOC122388210 [Amphibalanus amphitrite]